jgi:glycosyltransferase involved in cell wall biosynthesis
MASGRLDRMRILLIAEMCNPAWTSVPLVGYNLARALASRPQLNVTLVTQIRNKLSLHDDPISQLAKVHFIDSEFVAAPIFFLAKLLRGGTGKAWTLDTASMWPSYLMFEHIVFKQFRRRLERGEFDLIHRISPLSPVFPSPLAGWTDVPMLIGPLNGGLPFPKEFPELRKREREWLKPLRSLYKLMPYFRSTWKNLKGAIAASRYTEKDFPIWYRGRRFFLPENGVDPQRFPLAPHWPEPAGPFRFITVGRLVSLKAIDLIIEAMAGSESLNRCRLAIVGDGPERQNLEAIAQRYALRDSIEFLGWLDQTALTAEYAKSQAFVFPSLKEFGGGVIMEAMSAALPSIVVNYGGPGELISAETGVRLPMQPRAELIVALRREMERLADDYHLCRKLGDAAVREVSECWTWDAKAGRVIDIYRELLGLK